MRVKDFYRLVDLEQNPDASMLVDLEQLTKKYPQFQAGIFIYIKCLYITDAQNYVSELNRLTPFVHDRKALFYYVLNEVYERFQAKPKVKQVEDRTNMLIDAFFETSVEKPKEERVDPLAYAIQNPSMASLDYLSYIGISKEEEMLDPIALIDKTAQTEDMPKMRGQEMIDRFLSKSQELETPILISERDNNLASNEDLVIEEESDDDFFFTQTLVDIYMKQKKYERAYEIIKRLSLNYPEKNIYFADQLKILEKHIGNIE